MVKKMLIPAVALGLLTMGTSAFAGSSYATISKTQTSATGATSYMSDRIDVWGYNYSSSERRLSVEAWRSIDWQPDDYVTGVLLSPGKQASTYTVNQPYDEYYVELDPEGIGTSGCAGEGEVWG